MRVGDTMSFFLNATDPQTYIYRRFIPCHLVVGA